MSLIVVEGVDASGKSTLLENARLQIPKRYFVQLRHSRRPLNLSHALHFMRVARYASDVGLDVIIDRHPLISESIYGPLLRGSSLFDAHMHLDRETARIDVLKESVERVVYCRPSDDIILANVDKNPQLEGVKEKLLRLLDAYDHLMVELSNAGLKVFLYDYTTHTGTLEDLFFGENA